MRALYLVKNGKAEKALTLKETDIPEVGVSEIRIKSEAFGLNFADVMARLGLYPDAPKKPAILGYDVVGIVDAISSDVSTDLKEGDRVIALTRFGGYGEYVSTDYRGVVKINEDMSPVIATALATQGGTAFYMAHEMVNIFEGDHVLVHAAAGGVGSLLCQMAKAKGAIVYGTAGSNEKLEYLKSIGVDYPINYRSQKFEIEIGDLLQRSDVKGLDVVFDAIGGSSVRKGLKLLNSGGRIILFGASAMTSAKNVFSKIGVGLGFGIFHPVALLDPSKSMIAVNMLRIADDKPEIINRVLKGAIALYEQGVIRPKEGGLYPIEDFAKAHSDLEMRKTMGKLAIKW